MTTGVFPLPFAGPGDALERAAGAQRRVAQVEAEKVEHLATYLAEAAAEAGPMGEGPTSRGAERVHRYGGDGTPAIPEFTVCEIAAALGLAQRTAAILVGDVLDLVHRLPMLYDSLQEGLIDLWRLRKVASATRDLSEVAAREADFRLAACNVARIPLAARVSSGRLDQILDQVRHDLGEAPDNGDDNRNGDRGGHDPRYLDIGAGADGLAGIHGELSVADAARLDRRLRMVAGWLRELGDRRPLPVLLSEATGWLAEPARLATLHQQVINHRTLTNDTADRPTDDADAVPTEGTTGTEPAVDEDPGELPAAYRRARMPATRLYLHWDHTSDTFSLDGIGATSKREAQQILAHSHVTVTPVIDLASNPAYTGYVAPPRLKEHTALLNAGLCTFPSCGRQARHGEYDHITDHRAGGATDARNGHRLCKHHHRAKTFTDWRVQSPAPGIWLWRSPKGRHYVVTAGTTTRLDTRPLDLAAHHAA